MKSISKQSTNNSKSSIGAKNKSKKENKHYLMELEKRKQQQHQIDDYKSVDIENGINYENDNFWYVLLSIVNC